MFGTSAICYMTCLSIYKSTYLVKHAPSRLHDYSLYHSQHVNSNRISYSLATWCSFLSFTQWSLRSVDFWFTGSSLPVLAPSGKLFRSLARLCQCPIKYVMYSVAFCSICRSVGILSLGELKVRLELRLYVCMYSVYL